MYLIRFLRNALLAAQNALYEEKLYNTMQWNFLWNNTIPKCWRYSMFCFSLLNMHACHEPLELFVKAVLICEW